MQGNSIHTLVHMLVGMLFFTTLVGILARKMRFPYTVGLVLMQPLPRPASASSRPC
jgi:hypothetical protein